MTMRWAFVSGAIVLLLAADASPRSSQVRLTDPVGDVFLSVSPVSDAQAKTLRNVDIIGTVIRRTSRYLQVRITYQNLVPRGSRNWNVDFDVTTSGSTDYSYNVVWERGQWSDDGWVNGKRAHTGDWYQDVNLAKVTSEDGGDSHCPHAATASVDYSSNTLTIRVASRCLNHNPTWMRVEGLTTAAAAPHSKPGRGEYADNPFNSTWSSGSTPPLLAPSH